MDLFLSYYLSQTGGNVYHIDVPACTAPEQRGCVIAWSTFNEDPPSNSRYGRSPVGYDVEGAA